MNPLTRHIPYIVKNVDKLRSRQVLIVGDVGLDEYVLGQVRRISPEAPVPVVEVDTEEARVGLSANVAQNVASLGGTPVLVAVVGRDGAAEQLRGLLSRAGVSPEHLVVDGTRPTTRKLRVMVANHHIVRVDYERVQFLKPELEAQVLERVRACIQTVSAVIIQDYAKGVISESLAQEIIQLAKAAGKKVLVDPHRTTPLAYYRGADLMKPNYVESVALSGEKVDDLRIDPDHLNRIGQKLMAGIASSTLVITRGKDGMRLFDSGRVTDLPTFARQVFDVTGAGDTVIAALALAWGGGFPLEDACALANFAAGVVVEKVGCVPCSTQELLEYMNTHTQDGVG
ncbi:MAG: D-glycero-beta-D-manno-heptose-7-phosphate kinase [Bdellovibrionaceae bacterium]|nr:D-glycero-beta-D-manno-heptose-7-phosphate kinase [Pseudobdellovibrionaceae bacterium]